MSPRLRRTGKVLLALAATARLLLPAPSAGAAPAGSGPSGSLPHRERLAPGVHAAGFAAAHGSANSGWVVLEAETLLIDLPRGIPVPAFLKLVGESTGKPARSLALTHARDGDAAIVSALCAGGIARVVASPATRALLLAQEAHGVGRSILARSETTAIGDAAVSVEFRPMDGIAGRAGAVVYVPGRSVLFGGPLVVHGPRAALPGSDTERWVEALRPLEALAPAHVVPGSGSWGGPEVLARHRRFLAELRRQVGYVVAQGRPRDVLGEQVKLPAEFFAWMPYDTPTIDDLDHVYRELTVPIAPFHGREPAKSDPRPHALVLIGDQPHEPGHIEDGLRPVFEAAGVVPHFTVDVKALSARNLAMVRLLVILRDGLQRPETNHRADFVWMTPEQQRAVLDFVEAGGGFLNLHNSMGLYPPDGPYLELVGGRYTGHGPLERFRVEVVDAEHPVTRGVGAFFVADEQHTPVYDEKRVHLLLRSRSDDGRTVAAAGWVREPGRGRVCHLAPGHTREAILHPMYQRLLRNAVRWCLRVDGGGATSRAGMQRAGHSTAGRGSRLEPGISGPAEIR